MLIDCGAKPDLPDNMGQTPLSHAAQTGQENLVQLFLAKGADPNSKDYSSNTPLSFAAGQGNEKIVEMLGQARKMSCS
jgi:ankyrin repeat protein